MMHPISQLLIAYYKKHKRDLPWRNTKNPYFIWLSEVILQQTRVEQGLPYYLKFTERFPTVHALSIAEIDEVLSLWQGLGYYARARNLHQAAKQIANRADGFPGDYNALLGIKGIGPYTAAAVASFAFNERVAVVDGNVHRVISRLFDIDLPVNEKSGHNAVQQIASELIEGAPAAEFNQAIMEFGATWCKPKSPNCEACTLKFNCMAYSANTVLERPVKLKKLKIKTRYLHYLFMWHNNELLMRKRNTKEIWGGLYEPVLIETDSDLTFNLKTASKALDLNEDDLTELHFTGDTIHQLTHQKLVVKFYEATSYKIDLANYKWYHNDAAQQLPVSRLIERYWQKQTNQLILKLN